MKVTIINENQISIAVVHSDTSILADVQSALDMMATIHYEYDCQRIVLHKSAIPGDFFDLSTRLAGEILQKFINYQVKLAIVGDFSGYTSKALRDFICESNNGDHIFFVPSEEEAIARLLQSD